MNMDKKNRRTSETPDIAAVEADLFQDLFLFHKKAMDLLRNSGLEDDKLDLVANRIKQLLADVTAEMQQTKNLNLKEPLESAYEELKRMVAELSDPNHRGPTCVD